MIVKLLSKSKIPVLSTYSAETNVPEQKRERCEGELMPEIPLFYCLLIAMIHRPCPLPHSRWRET